MIVVDTSAVVAYGKGSCDPAALSFGEFLSYALAKTRGVPLLFKGADISQTDIETAAIDP